MRRRDASSLGIDGMNETSAAATTAMTPGSVVYLLMVWMLAWHSLMEKVFSRMI